MESDISFASRFRCTTEQLKESLLSKLESLVTKQTEEHGVLGVNDALFKSYWNSDEFSEEDLQRIFAVDRGHLLGVIQSSHLFIKCGACDTIFSLRMIDREHNERLTEVFMVLCRDCAEHQRILNDIEGQRKLDESRAERVRAFESSARSNELRSMPYQEYLDSPEWKAKRLLVLDRDGHICRLCSSSERLNVHHRTYDNRGDEPLEDLTTLCQACHEMFHANGSLARPAN